MCFRFYQFVMVSAAVSFLFACGIKCSLSAARNELSSETVKRLKWYIEPKTLLSPRVKTGIFKCVLNWAHRQF